MRYWVYLNDKVEGPYEEESLVTLQGFTPDTLLCSEDNANSGHQDWVKASSLFEFDQVVPEETPLEEPQPQPQPAEQPQSNDLAAQLLSKLETLTNQISGLQIQMSGMQTRMDGMQSKIDENIAAQQQSAAASGIPPVVAPMDITDRRANTITLTRHDLAVEESNIEPPAYDSAEATIAPQGENPLDMLGPLNLDNTENATTDSSGEVLLSSKEGEDVVLSSAMDSMYNAQFAAKQEEMEENTFQDLLSPANSKQLNDEPDNKTAEKSLDDALQETEKDKQAGKEAILAQFSASDNKKEDVVDQLIKEKEAHEEKQSMTVRLAAGAAAALAGAAAWVGGLAKKKEEEEATKSEEKAQKEESAEEALPTLEDKPVEVKEETPAQTQEAQPEQANQAADVTEEPVELTQPEDNEAAAPAQSEEDASAQPADAQPESQEQISSEEPALPADDEVATSDKTGEDASTQPADEQPELKDEVGTEEQPAQTDQEAPAEETPVVEESEEPAAEQATVPQEEDSAQETQQPDTTPTEQDTPAETTPEVEGLEGLEVSQISTTDAADLSGIEIDVPQAAQEHVENPNADAHAEDLTLIVDDVTAQTIRQTNGVNPQEEQASQPAEMPQLSEDGTTPQQPVSIATDAEHPEQVEEALPAEYLPQDVPATAAPAQEQNMDLPSLSEADEQPETAEETQNKPQEEPLQELVPGATMEAPEDVFLTPSDLDEASNTRDLKDSSDAAQLEGLANADAVIQAAKAQEEAEATALPQEIPSLDQADADVAATQTDNPGEENPNDLSEIELKEGSTYLISDFVPPAQVNDVPKELAQADGQSAATNTKGEVEIQDIVGTEQPNTPVDLPEAITVSQVSLENTIQAKRGASLDIKTVPMVPEPANAERLDLTMEDDVTAQHDIQTATGSGKTTKMVIGGLVALLLACVVYVLLGIMHIIPDSINVFGASKAQQTQQAAQLEEMLTPAAPVVAETTAEQPAEEPLDPMQAVLSDVKNYPLSNGYTLAEFIETKHPNAQGLITWDISTAVDPDNYSVLVKVPPENPQSFKISYRFNYNAVTQALDPTISDAKNLLDEANQ